MLIRVNSPHRYLYFGFPTPSPPQVHPPPVREHDILWKRLGYPIEIEIRSKLNLRFNTYTVHRRLPLD
jgi:hypothetical protein